MARKRVLAFAVSVLFLAAPVLAAEPPKMTPEQQKEMELYMKAATPGKEHKDLASMAGNYDLKVKSWMEPGAPPVEDSGTATRTTMLEGRVLSEDVQGTMMGGGMPFAGHGMMGFDNVTGKYWSTWSDTMGTGLMTSEGTCDASKACTFKGTWNDPVKKGPVHSTMKTRWTSPTTEVFEMWGTGKDGKETKMMEITYTKK